MKCGCVEIPINDLKHVIEIQRDVGTELDSFGQREEDWQTIHETRAKFESLSGRELEQARQLYAQTTKRVTIRHRNGLKTTDRILFKGRTYGIGFIDNVNEEDVIDRILVANSE